MDNFAKAVAGLSALCGDSAEDVVQLMRGKIDAANDELSKTMISASNFMSIFFKEIGKARTLDLDENLDIQALVGLMQTMTILFLVIGDQVGENKKLRSALNMLAEKSNGGAWQ
jgi:hypothetical protein